MNQCVFLELQRAQIDEEHKALLKSEQPLLSKSSSDLPLSSRTAENGDAIEASYVWSSLYDNSPFLRVKTVVFRKGEGLEKIYRLRVRDGADTIALRLGAVLYLMRKTTRDVAKALFSAYENLKGHAEEIIGYLETLAGNFYSISKLAAGCWTFNAGLAEANGLNHLAADELDDRQRQRLFELVCDKVLALHSKNLTLTSFSLDNIIFTDNDAILTDLRQMRSTRKLPVLVDDFIRTLSYLVKTGIATRGDVYQSVISYSVSMQKATGEWYSERKGSNAADALAVVSELEQAAYG